MNEQLDLISDKNNNYVFQHGGYTILVSKKIIEKYSENSSEKMMIIGTSIYENKTYSIYKNSYIGKLIFEWYERKKNNKLAEYICMNCYSVFHSGSAYAKCCSQNIGEGLEEFFPDKHGRLLIGNSNAWISIRNKNWNRNKIYNEVYQRYIDNGSWGAANIMNGFIQELIERISNKENDE